VSDVGNIDGQFYMAGVIVALAQGVRHICALLSPRCLPSPSRVQKFALVFKCGALHNEDSAARLFVVSVRTDGTKLISAV
jgi:hypothetical protein